LLNKEEEMKKWNLLAMVFVLSAIFCLAASGAAYSGGKMIDLDTLGGEESYATGINNSGQIVGWSLTTSGEKHAFLKNPGEKMKDMGTFGGKGILGKPYSIATGINGKGQVVGTSILDYDFDSTGTAHSSAYCPFLCSGVPIKLLDISWDPNWLHDWWPNGINYLGEIVGYYGTILEDERGFLYSGGTVMTLWDGSKATAINDNSEVVGYYYLPDTYYQYYAFYYKKGGAAGVTLPPPGNFEGGQSWAYGINNKGQIVGYYLLLVESKIYEAFLYSEGKMDTLPGCESWFNTKAYAINNNGQVVGSGIYTETFQYKPHAFLLAKSNGKLMDLGTLEGKKESQSCATAINDRGQIVGWSQTASGKYRAFLYEYNPSQSLPGILPLLLGSD
jgi:probable HAF family extracellular repeat protein